MLFGLHVGGRKLLRWHRIRDGYSRTILYWVLPDAAVDFYLGLQVQFFRLRALRRQPRWFAALDPAPRHRWLFSSC